MRVLLLGQVQAGLVLRQGHPRGGWRGDLLGQVQVWLVQGWCSGKVTQGEEGGGIYWYRYRHGWSRVGAQARSPKGRGEEGSTGTGIGMVGPGLVFRQVTQGEEGGGIYWDRYRYGWSRVGAQTGHPREGGRGEGRSTGTGIGMVGPGLVLRQVTQGEEGGEIYWDRYRYGWSRAGAQARSPKGRWEEGSTGAGIGMVGPGLVLRQGHPRGGGRGDLLGWVQAWLVQGWCSGKVTQGEEGGGIYWYRYRHGWSRVGAQTGHPRGGGRGDLLGQVKAWLVRGWCSGTVTEGEGVGSTGTSMIVPGNGFPCRVIPGEGEGGQVILRYLQAWLVQGGI